MPDEGQRDSKGRTFTGGRWRTTAKVHSMACYSVVEQLKRSGPLDRAALVSLTGLVEIRAARAIEMCLADGRIKAAGQGRYYVVGADPES